MIVAFVVIALTVHEPSQPDLETPAVKSTETQALTKADISVTTGAAPDYTDDNNCALCHLAVDKNEN